MHFGDDAEPAEAAHLQLGEVVGGHVLDHPPAGAYQPPVAGRDGAAKHVIAHGAEAITQRAGGAGRQHRAEASLRPARRIEAEPHPFVGEPPPQRLHGRARLDRGHQVGGTHREHEIERAGAHRKIGRGVGREPGAVSLDPDLPALVVRQSAHQRERVGRVRRRAGEPGGIALHSAGAEQRAQATEDDVAHRPAGVARHSRQAWTGTTLPGFARSSGSKARRTARMAARVSGSKMSGM